MKQNKNQHPPSQNEQLGESSLYPSENNTYKYVTHHLYALMVAFAMMLGLVSLVTWYGITNMALVQQQLENIVDNHMEKVIATTDMETIARLRIMNMYRMSLTPDAFERDEINMELRNLANQFARSRIYLLSLGMSEEEEKLLKKQGEYTGVALPLQSQVNDLMFEGKRDLAFQLLMSEVTPAQDNVSKVLKELYQYQLKQSKQAVDVSKEKYRETLNGMLWLSASALGIGVLIVVVVVMLVYKSNVERERHLHDLKKMNKESVKAANELAIANEQANIANEAKSSFIANMSHEMRTPLTAIIGFSEDILESAKLDNKSRFSAQTIVKNGKHLLRIINEILDISKIESGKLEIEKLNVSLISLLLDIKSLLKLQVEEKGLELTIDCKFPLPEHIYTDPTRLKQILLNLCFNSIKFTDKGGIIITVQYDMVSNFLEFRVKDTGIGMTPEQMQKVFDDFTQGDASTTRKYGGTGLGLSISKHLAQRLDGEISVESVVGLGSVFALKIDLGESHSMNLIYEMPLESDYAVKVEKTPLAANIRGNILIAEDNLDNQNLIKLLISKTQADADVVNNGKELLDLIQVKGESSYDMIFMDMQMPVMDGLQTIRELRTLGIKLPVISLTANARKEDVDSCYRAGCSDFLSKPIDRKEFYNMIDKYLGDKNQDNSSLESGGNVEGDTHQALHDQPENDIDDSFNELVQRYITSLGEKKLNLERLYQSKDEKGLKALLHELKGTGGSFGYIEITQRCARLEDELKQGGLAAIDKSLSQLCEYLSNIVEAKIN